MKFLKAPERAVAEAVSQLVHCNPFLPERIEAERAVLGDAFVASAAVWSASDGRTAGRANVRRIASLVDAHCQALRERLVDGACPTPAEATLYEDLVLYKLYYRHVESFERTIDDLRQGRPPRGLAGVYVAFVDEYRHFVDACDPNVLTPHDPAHLFAGFFQIRRAFGQTFESIVGASMPAARLRAQIWQSVFTHDMRRYRRVLYDKAHDFTTLVVGPSGTGKELVARAIGASRYIPFDPKAKAFAEDFAASFYPLNLSALSPTLVESELFGHRRGAFTGAIEDRPGWLQTCPALGTVFLDEIGELDPGIQVKLLRVLQTRQFQRLGDTKSLAFRGKLIAATNRDLGAEMRDGRFRTDFYYRLCADIIVTPGLREQLADAPGELPTLVRYVAHRLVGDEADDLTAEVMANIARHLGPDYAWPGNFRELEQCVRNVMIRGEYRPTAPPAPGKTDEAATLAHAIAAGALTADELLGHYCRQMYRLTGTYEAAAKRLGLDRRTVRAKAAMMEG